MGINELLVTKRENVGKTVTDMKKYLYQMIREKQIELYCPYKNFIIDKQTEHDEQIFRVKPMYKFEPSGLAPTRYLVFQHELRQTYLIYMNETIEDDYQSHLPIFRSAVLLGKLHKNFNPKLQTIAVRKLDVLCRVASCVELVEEEKVEYDKELGMHIIGGKKLELLQGIDTYFDTPEQRSTIETDPFFQQMIHYALN